MSKVKPVTKNATLLRLKNTPFENAKQLKAAEARLRAEEWESMERARLRKAYYAKPEYRGIIAPLLNGFTAKVVGGEDADLVRVYLTSEDRVHVEVASNVSHPEDNLAVQTLVRSLTESFMNGYFTALGLRDDEPVTAKKIRR